MARIFPNGLSGSAIKGAAVVCMAIDHAAFAFVPTLSGLGVLLHVIGRVTAPCMCFFIAEGCAHTRNPKRYALRLGVFALLSWPCFSYFETGRFFAPEFGMLYSLFFALLAVLACEKLPGLPLKILAVAACCLATEWGDWHYFAVLYAVAFWAGRGDFRKQALLFCGVSLLMLAVYTGGSLPYIVMNLGVFLALPLLAAYNGRRGGEGCPKLSKWGFYVFYPAHLLLLGVFKGLV